MRSSIAWMLLLLALPVAGAERILNFSEVPEGNLPPGFVSTVVGSGKPGDWKVVWDEIPSPMPSLTPGAPSVMRHPVLAQTAQDPTDEHFPLLIYDKDVYGDFTLSVRVKMVKGSIEQMAGVAFRVQNESNYYLVRASALGNTFRFYKVLNGQRGPLVGPELPIPAGVWHSLTVECKGNAIRCLLDGKELISVSDKANAFLTGKIAFWTKSDSVSYFSDPTITFVPREPPLEQLTREMIKHYPKLLGLQVYCWGKETNTTRVVASKDAAQVGQQGGAVELDVMQKGITYYGKEKGQTSVVMPLRDRNGDPLAAVRVIMKPYPGELEEAAVNRAAPIIWRMQARIRSLDDLIQ